MPNWVRNKIIVNSHQKLMELVLAHCPVSPSLKTPQMDFNTILSLPKNLNIEFGSRSDDGIRLYLTWLNPMVTYFGKTEEKLPSGEWVELNARMRKHVWFQESFLLTEEQLEELKGKYRESLDKILALGKQCVDNVLKHQAMNWYEWSVTHWGTKWNATNTVIGETELYFDTAWDSPVEAIRQMSRQHPSIRLALLYSDEQIGYHTGYVMMTAGKIDYQGTFEDESKEAFQLAFEIWHCQDMYDFDEEEQTFVPKNTYRDPDEDPEKEEL